MTRASERRWQRTGAAVVAVLAAIGVAVAFVMGGAGVPEPGLVVPADAHDATAASAGLEGTASARRSSEGTHARAQVPAAVPARSLRLRVMQRLGKSTTHYTGPLRVLADDEELLATTLANGLPLALAVAGDATALRFEAPGFVADDVALGSRDADGAARDVVLVPDSGLRFRFLGRSDGGAGETAIRVLVFASDVTATSEQRARAGEAPELDVPMLRDRELRWCAAWLDGSRRCAVRGVEPPLAGGEQRRVVVDFAAVRMQRHVVVGPSAELLPHLVVEWQEEDDGVVRVPLGADGGFERAAAVTSPVRVGATATLLELACEHTARATVWRPLLPLLGVGLVDGSGALVPTVPLHSSGETLGSSARVHVFARESVPQPLGLGVHGAPPLQFAIDRASARDLVLVRAGDALAPTRLVVEVTGEAPAEAARKGLGLGARLGGDARPLTRGAAPRVVFDLPRGGDCTLSWQCGTRTRDVVTVHVVAGREQIAKLQWPAAVAWTGEVAGYGELPPERRWHRIGFPDQDVQVGAVFDAMLGRALHRVDQHGRFEFVRFADEPPREPATLCWGAVPMAARIVASDGTRHHVVVQPADGLRWVEVDVEVPRPWRLVLFRAGAGNVPRAVHSISDRQQLPVPVAGSTPLLGALFVGDATAPVAWCELRGDEPRATLRAEPLRRVELRARTACERRQVYLVGPGGQWDLGHDLATTQPLVLEAPASTRGIGLWNDGASVREIPLGASGVVVID